MASIILSSTSGAMNSIITKLFALLGSEFKFLSGVHKDIEFLKHELSYMNAILRELSDKENLDTETKVWRDNVHELSYDIGDCIDTFMEQLNCDDENVGLVHKATKMVKNLWVCHQALKQIEELRDRVMQESKRRKRYKLDESCSKSIVIKYADPRVPALYPEVDRPVGIDGPCETIMQWLTEEWECSSLPLKIISVLGFGGIGKTTLARLVLDKTKEIFHCTAFVSVSQNPNISEILKAILVQVGVTVGVQPEDPQTLIAKTREYLRHKRYLIIIDDLWTVESWNIIRCAFAQNNNGSGVLTTTRIEDVAMACCLDSHGQVYKMKPLDVLNSRRLFFKRIFNSEEECPKQFIQISEAILKKCHGVPLAILSIASLLACQGDLHMDKWETIKSSLSFEMERNPNLAWMRHVFDLSYNGLSQELKTCLLCLHTYPEDYEIYKDDLIERWIAEGFVGEKYGQDMEFVGESYFCELVNRSMIQPFRFKYGELVSCRVHDLMLDFIAYKSLKANFLKVFNERHCTKGTFKVRRLCLQGHYGTIPLSMSLSCIRSFSCFRYSIKCPPLSEFSVLRVLYLYLYGSIMEMESYDLSAICKLFQLRYLRIHGNYFKLPKKIGGLRYLQVLKVGRYAYPKHLTDDSMIIDVNSLQLLRHLEVPPSEVELTNGIGKLTCLRTLSLEFHRSSIENVWDLDKLTNLRSLDIMHHPPLNVHGEKYNLQLKSDALASTLCKLGNHNLRFLDLPSFGLLNKDPINDLLSCWSPAPRRLQRLHTGLRKITKVPEWIAQVGSLTSLQLAIQELTTDGIRILEDLPCLTYLELWAFSVPGRSIIIIDSFPCLKEFKLQTTLSCSLLFKPGAMPKLEVLKLFFFEDGVADQYCSVVSGIEHLKCLDDILVHLVAFSSKRSNELRNVVREAIYRHPRSHAMRICIS